MLRIPARTSLLLLLLALAGTAHAASVMVSPPVGNFGSVTVGESTSLSFTSTFSNYSPLDFAGVDIYLQTGTQYSVLNDSCDILGCNFEVRFAPTSVGSKGDTLSVKLLLNGGQSSTSTVALAGVGVAPVPAPAALPLLLTALAAVGIRGVRSRTRGYSVGG